MIFTYQTENRIFKAQVVFRIWRFYNWTRVYVRLLIHIVLNVTLLLILTQFDLFPWFWHIVTILTIVSFCDLSHDGNILRPFPWLWHIATFFADSGTLQIFFHDCGTLRLFSRIWHIAAFLSTDSDTMRLLTVFPQVKKNCIYLASANRRMTRVTFSWPASSVEPCGYFVIYQFTSARSTNTSGDKRRFVTWQARQSDKTYVGR